MIWCKLWGTIITKPCFCVTCVQFASSSGELLRAAYRQGLLAMDCIVRTACIPHGLRIHASRTLACNFYTCTPDNQVHEKPGCSYCRDKRLTSRQPARPRVACHHTDVAAVAAVAAVPAATPTAVAGVCLATGRFRLPWPAAPPAANHRSMPSGSTADRPTPSPPLPSAR